MQIAILSVLILIFLSVNCIHWNLSYTFAETLRQVTVNGDRLGRIYEEVLKISQDVTILKHNKF